MTSDIGQHVKDGVEAAMNEMVKKCGPNASSIINDQCFGSCDGTLNVVGSTCTCNGSPCETWKISDTGPKATSSDSTNAAVSNAVIIGSPMFLTAIATSLVLLAPQVAF